MSSRPRRKRQQDSDDDSDEPRRRDSDDEDYKSKKKTRKAPVAPKNTPECAISKADFSSKAKVVKANINGQDYELEAKDLRTGSFGWTLSGKQSIIVDGVEVPVQVSVNLTVINSKYAK